MSHAAVVVNPTKFDGAEKLAEFRDLVSTVMAEHGWAEPAWLETAENDPGEGQARRAVQAGADVVMAVGGDGTVTSCAAGMAGTGVPMAVIAFGTGNLLARNLGLPLDPREAVVLAVTGTDREFDVGSANGQSFVAMAGLGLDAKMLSSASDSAKKRFGWIAYAGAALKHLWDRPMRITISADGGPAVRRRAAGVIIGNVGWLQGGLPLMPDAEPDDGALDAIVLAARGWSGWLVVAVLILLRREAGRVLRLSFRELTVRTDREYLFELDGEVIGPTGELTVSLHDQKLILRVPVA
jgi:diacylglycerol kinase family enzyme